MSWTGPDLKTADLDLRTVLKASREIAGEIELNSLLAKLLTIAMENAGAQQGYLIREQDEQWIVVAQAEIDQVEPEVIQSVNVEAMDTVSAGIVHYVVHTREHIVLNDAANQGRFINDPTIRQRRPKSILCAPFINQDKISGIVYLENNLATGAFTRDRVELINLLSSQMALALDNAQLYVNLVRSEAKYRSLVDNSNIGVFATTTDGRFTFVNDAMARMFDFDSTELMIAKGSLERWKDPKDRERMLAELQKHGRVTNFEAETITHTDRHIHVIFSAKKIGDRISGMVTDISDRKQAEIELKEAYTEIEQLQIQLQAESAYLQEEIKLEHNFENIIGQSEALKYVLHRVEMVAPKDSTVILLGETGTGKELIARALHRLSSRNKRLLVKVNCAALPGELIESELFGREKGAFTGATTTQIGRFELANRSTLFLDEIGELPLELQAKLLRILESGEFERLGSSRTLHSDARIITATNRDLEAEVRKKRFREDLWYRLKVFPITVPPLRDRIEDIPLLVNNFIQLFSRKMGIRAQALKIPKRSMQALQSYFWPGNVRELKHAVESALISLEGNKLHFDLPRTADVATGKLKSFEEMEREYILEVLKAKNWKIEGKDSASSILGMPPSTLRSRIKKLGLKRP